MNVQIIDKLSEAQIDDLVQLYRLEWWSGDRQPEAVRQMLQYSDVIIGLCKEENSKLIGFARVLTDFVYRATIFDVIVESSYRDRGLGRQLVEAIVNHPRLTSVEVFILMCLNEMVPFYKKFGFTAMEESTQVLVKSRV